MNDVISSTSRKFERVEDKFDKFATDKNETINDLLEKINNTEKKNGKNMAKLERSNSDMKRKLLDNNNDGYCRGNSSYIGDR